MIHRSLGLLYIDICGRTSQVIMVFITQVYTKVQWCDPPLLIFILEICGCTLHVIVDFQKSFISQIYAKVGWYYSPLLLLTLHRHLWSYITSDYGFPKGIHNMCDQPIATYTYIE